MPGTVVLFGVRPARLEVVEREASAQGWSVIHVADLPGLHRAARTQHPVVSVLFDPEPLGWTWREGLGAVEDNVPGAHPIVCQGFLADEEWAEQSEEGIFYRLRYPFHETEVRQCFGFVAEAVARMVNTAARRAPRSAEQPAELPIAQVSVA